MPKRKRVHFRIDIGQNHIVRIEVRVTRTLTNVEKLIVPIHNLYVVDAKIPPLTMVVWIGWRTQIIGEKINI